MRKVFEHPTSHEVGHYESILRSHGIETFINNQNASALMGEIPVVAVYPELWVLNDEDYDRAVSLLHDYRRARPFGVGTDWVCASCGEEVPGSFSACWNCQNERSEDATERSSPGGAVASGESAAALPPTRYALTLTCMVVAVIASLWGTVSQETAYWALVPASSEVYLGRWDGLLGSIFVHLDFMHLAFNLFWFWLFGSLVETYFGRAFWIYLFLCTAFVASGTELAFVGELGVGLSGVVYGLFGFLFLVRSRYPAIGRAINRTVVLWLIGSFVLCFPLTFAKVYMVANGAHTGGLLAGALVGWFWGRSRKAALYACAGLMILSFASVLYAPWAPSFQAARAYRLLQKGNTGEALVLLDGLARSDGDHAPWAVVTAVETYESNGDYSGAADFYEKLLPEHEKDSDFLNGYAWLLATAPDANARNGVKAVQFANTAAELTGWKDAAVLDTLAAAYAEAGDFKSALRWQTAVLDMGLEGADVKERMELYRRLKAYRQPLPASAEPQKH